MKVKDLCLMTVCLCILIICSKIAVPIGVISITLQTFAVAIIPYILKWKRASIVLTAYILMGLIGIPVFSDGGGFFYVLKPSFGFILGFFFQSFVSGSTLFQPNKIAHFIKGILGLFIIDIVGMLYMYIILRFYMHKEAVSLLYILEIGFLPFIVKDIFSVLLAGVISLRLNPILDTMGIYNQELINSKKEMGQKE
jgi:biotin transport system substrate-specific component